MFDNCDPCVANKVVEGKQQTVQFHVNDFILSHADKKINNKFLKWLNCKYRVHSQVTSTRGEEHEHSGMKFAFRDGKFSVNVTGKVKEILDKFLIKFKDDKSKKVTMPASGDMFNVIDSVCLDAQKRELFHHAIAQTYL